MNNNYLSQFCTTSDIVDTLKVANPPLWDVAVQTFIHYKGNSDFFIAEFKLVPYSLNHNVAHVYYHCVRWALSNKYGV